VGVAAELLKCLKESLEQPRKSEKIPPHIFKNGE